MPSLLRFLTFCVLLGGMVFGAMVALDTFVEPHPREMRERIPPDRLPQ